MNLPVNRISYMPTLALPPTFAQRAGSPLSPEFLLSFTFSREEEKKRLEEIKARFKAFLDPESPDYLHSPDPAQFGQDRYQLIGLGHPHDLGMQKEALTLFIEVLEKTPLSEDTPHFANNLLHCEAQLRVLLSEEHFQMTTVPQQIILLEAYGAVIESVLLAYACGLIGRITQESRLAMLDTLRKVEHLSVDNNPQLKFAQQYAYEGLKRLRNDQGILEYTFKMVASLVKIAAALYQEDVESALNEAQVAYKNTVIPQKWFEPVFIMRQLAYRVMRQSNDAQKKHACLLNFQTHLRSPSKHWTFFYAAAELLSRLAIHHPSVETRRYALEGAPGPAGERLPGFFSLYDKASSGSDDWMVRYQLTKWCGLFWKSPEENIRKQVSAKLYLYNQSNEHPLVLRILRQHESQEEVLKAEGLQAQEKKRLMQQIEDLRKEEVQKKEEFLLAKEDEQTLSEKLEAQKRKIQVHQEKIALREKLLQEGTTSSEQLQKTKETLDSLNAQKQDLLREKVSLLEKLQACKSISAEKGETHARVKNKLLETENVLKRITGEAFHSYQASQSSLNLEKKHLSTEQNSLVQAGSDIQQEKEELEKERKDLDQKEQALLEQQKQIEKERQALQAEKDAHAARTSVTDKLENLETQKQHVDKEIHRVNTFRRKLQDNEDKLQTQKEELRKREEKITEQATVLKEKEELLALSLRGMQDDYKEIVEKNQDIEKRAQSLSQKEAQIAQREKELQSKERDFKAREVAYARFLSQGVGGEELELLQEAFLKPEEETVNFTIPAARSTYGAQLYKNEANQFYTDSHSYTGTRRKRLLDQAIALFLKALELCPTDEGAYKDLANAYIDNGQPEKALEVFHMPFMKRKQQYASPYFYMVKAKAYIGGKGIFEEKSRQKALLELENFLKDEGVIENLAFEQQARIYETQGKIFWAVLKRSLILQSSADKLARWDVEGFYKRSHNALREVSSYYETNEAQDETALGIKELQSGHKEKAISHLRTAIEKDPSYAQAYTELVGLYVADNNLDALDELGQFYCQKGEEEKGEKCLSFVVQARPSAELVARITYARSVTALNKGAVQEAQELLELLIGTPLGNQAYCLLGKIALQRQDLEEASRCYRIAWRAQSDSVSAAIGLTKCCLRLKNYHALFNEYPPQGAHNPLGKREYPLVELIFREKITSWDSYLGVLEILQELSDHTQEYLKILQKGTAEEGSHPAIPFLQELDQTLHTYLEKTLLPLTEQLKTIPLIPSERLRLGQVYLWMQRWDQAERYFKSLERITPVNPLVYLNLADFYMRRSSWNDFETYAELFVKSEGLSSSQKALGFLYLGKAQVQRGAYEEAVESYKKGLSQEGMRHNPELCYELALLLKSHDPQEARNYLSLSLQLAPSERAFTELFGLMEAAELYKEMPAYYQRALELYPAYLPFLKGYAQLLYRLEAFDTLLANPLLMRTLDPKFKIPQKILAKKEAQAQAEKLCQAAGQSRAKGTLEKALDEVKKAVRLCDSHPFALRLQGELLVENLFLPEPVKEEFHLRISAANYTPTLLVRNGLVQKGASNEEDALLYLGEAIARNVHQGDAIYEKWLALFTALAPQEAKRRSFSLSSPPSLSEKYLIAAYNLEKRAQWENAYLLCRMAKEYDPVSPQVDALWKSMQKRRSLLETAKESYEKAASLGDRESEILLAELSIRLGRWKEAQNTLKPYNKLHPTRLKLAKSKEWRENELQGLVSSASLPGKRAFAFVPYNTLAVLENAYSLAPQEEKAALLAQLTQAQASLQTWKADLTHLDVERLCALGYACEPLGYLEEARLFYEEALAKSPNHPHILLRLLGLLIRQGEIKVRVQDYQNRLNLQTKNAAHLLAPLAEIYAVSELKDLTKAVHFLKEAITYYPEEKMLYLRLASLLRSSNKAEEQIRKEIGADFPHLLTLMGIYYLADRPSKAVEYLIHAAKKFPESSLVEQALQQARKKAEEEGGVLRFMRSVQDKLS